MGDETIKQDTGKTLSRVYGMIRRLFSFADFEGEEGCQMATRGRKPTPTAIKELEGNPGKRKINEAELQETGRMQREYNLKTQKAFGIDLIPCNDFSFGTPAWRCFSAGWTF